MSYGSALLVAQALKDRFPDLTLTELADKIDQADKRRMSEVRRLLHGENNVRADLLKRCDGGD